MEIVESYVIVLNFGLILGSAILALFFFYGGERQLFRPMAIREVLLLAITLYSIFADNLLKGSKEWEFLIQAPTRPAIYRTPIVLGIWLVIFAFWRWRKANNNGPR